MKRILNMKFLSLFLSVFCMHWHIQTLLAKPASLYVHRMEAENARDDSGQWRSWKIKGASNSKALRCTWSMMTNHVKIGTFDAPQAGNYRIWIRLYKSKPGSLSLVSLVRDANGEEEGFTTMDWHRRTLSPTPYAPDPTQANEQTGFNWYHFDTTFETAGKKTLWVAGLRHLGNRVTRYVDCAVVTNNVEIDIASMPLDQIKNQTFTSKPTVPNGYQPAQAYPIHANFFASSNDRKKQLTLGAVTQIGLFRDYARFAQIGLNTDNDARNGEATAYGIKGTKSLDSFHAHVYPREKDILDFYNHFKKDFDPKQTNFINSEGDVGKFLSLSHPKTPELAKALVKRRYERSKDNIDVDTWRIAWEEKGWLDYSQPSVTAFRKWLKNKHQTIQTLNQRWNSQHTDFDAINPPTQAKKDMACWLEFNRFCAKVFADAVGRQVQWVRELDPQNRTISTQSSSLMLLSPFFTNKFPQDWEVFANRVYDKNMVLGWDGYSADDFNGCRVDLLRSLSHGVPMVHRECNIHSGDPRIAARTFWMEISKGSRGVVWFFYQPWDWAPPDKFSLLNGDLTPRDMLGAVGDVAMNARRLESILLEGNVTHTVKPVGMLYSRMDLSVTPPHPMSVWGGAANNHYHVYQMLRELGYPVQWVTPNQVRKGVLNELGALVLSECQFIPGDVSKQISTWVTNGGSIIGDRLPGGFNEYGQPQNHLQKVFGIQLAQSTKKAQGKIALENSAMGYGPETALVLGANQINESIGEVWVHKASTHPLTKLAPDFFLSGYGLTRVQCTDGQIIGLTLAGKYPGIIVNDFGKGHAMYCALMLGSLHNSAATGFEMQNLHTGTRHLELLDAFLKFSRCKPSYQAPKMSRNMTMRLRIESPIITPQNNAILGITNMSDRSMKQISLQLALPQNLVNARMVFWVPGGSREMVQLTPQFINEQMHVTLPRLDVYGSILMLNDFSRPFVSMKVQGALRGAANLLEIKPNTELEMEVTIYNPSLTTLKPGKISLYLPTSWFQDQASVLCPSIIASQSHTVSFRVKAGPHTRAKRLRPMSVQYENGTMTSMPCSELVWWKPPTD